MDHQATGLGKKTLSANVVGLVLSLVFTMVAYFLVVERALSDAWLYVSVVLLALFQFYTQLVCFLRLQAKDTEGKWNVMPLLFVLLIVLILVFGSIWIMINLKYNMNL